jgi:DNA end-binding protein Ku
MLHKKDLSRIRFQRVAESRGKEVPAEEIVKGYEVEKNQYLVLADEELREVAPERSTGIEIQEFVNESENLASLLRKTLLPRTCGGRLLLFYEKH